MKSDTIPFPPIPEDLLKELNNRWPEMSADIQWEEKTVWFASGQRSVIRFLNQVFIDQREIQLGSKE
jgi:hypothetical protein